MNGLVRTATFQSMWRVASDETIRLTLKSESAADETVIRFNEDATNEFDGDLDAFKMMNGTAVPSIYTMFGSTKYSINSIADPYAKDTIAVYTKIPADGDYVLSIATSDPAIEYVLVDKKLGTETVVTTRDYSFAALKTDDLNRFDLQMRQTTTTGGNTGTGTSSIAILSSPNGFLVKSTLSGTGTIEIMDVAGNVVKVFSNVSLSNGNNFFTPEVAGGFYLIRVDMDNTSYVDHVSIIR
ncbi:T9SS type A sorting domain-containing protein [Cytophaga aurantiaca]|uniref:T9SS type A sorting domain-containing protein n=1 Tax=Cytophaga aurantiaca TaxID=29530 RepID=UPI003CCBC37B